MPGSAEIRFPQTTTERTTPRRPTLIKIPSRAFDPFGFAVARAGVAAAAMLLMSALSGKVWPGSPPGLWAQTSRACPDRSGRSFILLAKAARLTPSADMALMMGA